MLLGLGGCGGGSGGAGSGGGDVAAAGSGAGSGVGSGAGSRRGECVWSGGAGACGACGCAGGCWLCCWLCCWWCWCWCWHCRCDSHTKRDLLSAPSNKIASGFRLPPRPCLPSRWLRVSTVVGAAVGAAVGAQVGAGAGAGGAIHTGLGPERACAGGGGWYLHTAHQSGTYLC
jgi:hypothetical protein